jgi:hypothetical protein
MRIELACKARRKSAWVRPVWRNQSFKKDWRSSSWSLVRLDVDIRVKN